MFLAVSCCSFPERCSAQHFSISLRFITNIRVRSMEALLYAWGVFEAVAGIF